MPFATTNPSNLTDAIADLADFYQNTMGWSVTHDAGAVTLQVTIPGKTAVFTISKEDFVYSGSLGGADFEVLVIDVANIASPIKAQVNWLNPITSMRVHADDAGVEPWSLITFESAPDYFHHACFGYVEKLGSYSGGAFADGTCWSNGLQGTYLDWDTNFNHLLFNGEYDKPSYDGDWGRWSGGLEIDHVDADSPIYSFSEEDGGYILGGGWGDAYNGLLSWVEPVGADGSINMQPVILFANLTGNNFLSPVACVPGVRMINCQPFENGQIVSIGGQNWQVFPMCNKFLPYGETGGDGSGPGNIQPDGSTFRLNIGGATERWGIAVLHEA